MAVAKEIPAALVVDDIDTTVGEWEMNTGTVNHQQVLAELMHVADQPVDVSRNFPRRVPIFVTGNNLAKLYPPLRRHGRMDTFAWRPERHELQSIVHGMFDHATSSRGVDLLVRDFGNEPISFFADIRRRLHEVDSSKDLANAGPDMRRFLRQNRGSWSDGVQRQFSEKELIEVAKRVQEEQQSALLNFLQEGKQGGERR